MKIFGMSSFPHPKVTNIAVKPKKTSSNEGLRFRTSHSSQLFFRWWEEIKEMWKYTEMKCWIPPVCGCSEPSSAEKAEGEAKSLLENPNLALKWPKAVPGLQGHRATRASPVRWYQSSALPMKAGSESLCSSASPAHLWLTRMKKSGGRKHRNWGFCELHEQQQSRMCNSPSWEVNAQTRSGLQPMPKLPLSKYHLSFGFIWLLGGFCRCLDRYLWPLNYGLTSLGLIKEKTRWDFALRGKGGSALHWAENQGTLRTSLLGDGCTQDKFLSSTCLTLESSGSVLPLALREGMNKQTPNKTKQILFRRTTESQDALGWKEP